MAKPIKMPKMPTPFYEWSDKEAEKFFFHGDMNDMPLRMATKLYNLWELWDALVLNEDLEKILKNAPSDKNSEEYRMKALIVHILDRMAKILTNSNLLQELASVAGAKQTSKTP